MDAALELVIAAGEREEFAGVPAAGEARVSRTEKWRYWRRDLADGSRVSINIQNKPGGKSVVAVNHDDMPTNERITELKTWWKEFLVEVAARS